MYSFVGKIFHFKLKYVLNNTRLNFLSYILWIYTSWKWILCGNYDPSLKNHISKFKKMDLHHLKENKLSEGSQTIQKDDLSRRVTTRKMLLIKYLTFKASSTWFKDQVQKSNVMWQDPKEALTSLKNWWTIKRLLFLFCVIFKG